MFAEEEYSPQLSSFKPKSDHITSLLKTLGGLTIVLTVKPTPLWWPRSSALGLQPHLLLLSLQLTTLGQTRVWLFPLPGAPFLQSFTSLTCMEGQPP